MGSFQHHYRHFCMDSILDDSGAFFDTPSPEATAESAEQSLFESWRGVVPA